MGISLIGNLVSFKWKARLLHTMLWAPDDISDWCGLTNAADIDERVASHHAQRRQPQQALRHCPLQFVRLVSYLKTVSNLKSMVRAFTKLPFPTDLHKCRWSAGLMKQDGRI